MLFKTQLTAEGKMLAPDSEKIREFLKKWAGQEVIFGVYEVGARRTQAQLRFFFGVLIDQIYRESLRDVGYSRSEVVSLCKEIGLGKRTLKHPKTQELVEVTRGLSDPDVDTLEMIICIWKIQNFMVDLGLDIQPDILIDQTEYEEAINKQKEQEQERYGDSSSR